MQQVRRILDLYINGSIHVGLAVVALSYITTLRLDISLKTSLAFFLFFGTVTAYNFVKYAAIAGLHHRSLARSLKKIQLISVISAIGVLTAAFWLSPSVLMWCFFLGLLTIFYAVPLLSTKGNLRSIAGIKIFIIAIVWAATTVVLPAVQEGFVFSYEIAITIIQRIVYVLAVMIPFEIRDVKYDNTQLRTVPQVIGVQKAKLLGVLLVVVFISCSIVLYEQEWVEFLAIESCIGILVIMLILRSNSHKTRYFTAFWVEGIPIFWLAMHWLIRFY